MSSKRFITTAERMFKSKPCKAMCETGVCHRTLCPSAHSIEELRNPICAHGNECEDPNCDCIHPSETTESYRKRIGFVMPVFKKAVPDTDTHCHGNISVVWKK